MWGPAWPALCLQALQGAADLSAGIVPCKPGHAARSDEGHWVETSINGTLRSCNAPGGSMAVYVLRNDLGLAGVRLGCGEGHCGACMVLLDGQPTTTCDLPFQALEGRQVRTPEGLGTPEQPHVVQAALRDAQAGQCGYCLSGILMTAVALVERDDPASEHEVRAALDRHLCRCGSQHRIVQAVMQAIRQTHAGAMPDAVPQVTT